jgi:hypothetical protein
LAGKHGLVYLALTSGKLYFFHRKTLFEDCPEYFNNETGLLEAPLVIKVADQVKFLVNIHLFSLLLLF